MEKVNAEIKARTDSHGHIKEVLKERGARFEGCDHQVDTYFRVAEGRLKLREGNIENALIFYEREDRARPKHSEVTLCKLEPGTSDLKQVLIRSLGIKAVVDKKREIHYLDNVKIHLDNVQGLGKFVEIEAAGVPGDPIGVLNDQVRKLMDAFRIEEDDLLTNSYCDMVKDHR